MLFETCLIFRPHSAPQAKLDRYALLAALAERQALDGLRAAAPTILPVAVSTHGEFCPGAVRVQEWLVGKYRERLRLEGDRDDGEKTEGLTAAFRQEFRASLLVASSKGLADMLLAAGMPFTGKCAHGGSSNGAGRANASPLPPPPPPPSSRPPLPESPSPNLGSGRGSQSPVPSEDEDDEDAESTASSSADSDDEEWLPPLREAEGAGALWTSGPSPESSCGGHHSLHPGNLAFPHQAPDR